MYRRFVSVITSVVVAVLLVSLLGADSRIFKVADIKPGMKGYGLTVFKGTEPERFEVEVVDVIHKFLPKQDVVLVKVSGHGLEETGIYQGMSGSPIFIDGKIMGALAYGWSYLKVPLTGITPIEYMLAELDRPLLGQKITKVPENHSSYANGRLVPISSPVMVSGLPSSLMGDLAEILESYHLAPFQGGGSAPATAAEALKLEPGSAIGVSIVRGDIDMTAIGTVTWVEGSKILAFGHPFMSGGEVNFPITTAKIITLLPRVSTSFKLGQAISEVGTLIQDRQSCVIGDTKSRAKMVPFDINVKNPHTGREESLNLEMVWDTNLTVRLMNMLLNAGLVYAEANAGENTADTTVEAKFKGYPPITLKNTYFNGKGPFHKMMLAPVAKMILNPFEKVELESLKVSVEVDPTIRIAFIKRIWMEEDEISPGGVGHIHVVLAPFGGDEVEKVMEVSISEEVAPGSKIMMGVAGGSFVIPLVAPPVDFPGVIEMFESLYKSTDVVFVQQLSTTGARVEGHVMTDLPPSAIRMLGASNATGPMLQGDFKMTAMPTDWVILGKAASQIKISKH